MTILTFDYTKSDGKKSKRVLLISGEPTHLFSGSDISHLMPQDQVEYSNAISAAKADYLMKLAEINAEFDMNYSFRQFKPDNMTNIVREEI